MTDQQLYQKVSKDLGIPIERVIAYDKGHWNQLKIALNNPVADVIEVPMLCTWVIIPSRMRATLAFAIRVMKRSRDKLIREPNNNRLRNDLEVHKKLFKELWQLKQQCKMH